MENKNTYSSVVSIVKKNEKRLPITFHLITKVKLKKNKSLKGSLLIEACDFYNTKSFLVGKPRKTISNILKPELND